MDTLVEPKGIRRGDYKQLRLPRMILCSYSIHQGWRSPNVFYFKNVIIFSVPFQNAALNLNFHFIAVYIHVDKAAIFSRDHSSYIDLLLKIFTKLNLTSYNPIANIRELTSGAY